MDNTIRFWGVRGSTPSPGTSTSGVGGNTSCVEVRLGGEQIIIDAGTGLRALGAAECGRPIRATILFSHVHWDHIQGIPFFAPLYHPESSITLIGPVGLEDALTAQMSQPTFPIGMDAFSATVEFIEVEPGDSFSIGEVEVTTAALNHPGGAIGYRLAFGRTAVAYLSDHEETEEGCGEGVLGLARGASALICDAQYTPEEYARKAGWGHSTFEQAAKLAAEAGAKALYLTHHEPTRTDEEVVELERRAKATFATVTAAREGEVVPCGSAQSGRHVASGPPAPSIAPQV